MYVRKTANAAELSEARRRASLARKSHGGGRPKGWRKRPGALPPKTVALDPLDVEVFRNYAAMRGFSIKDTMHLFAAVLVMGADVPKRPELAPADWKLRHLPQ